MDERANILFKCGAQGRIFIARALIACSRLRRYVFVVVFVIVVTVVCVVCNCLAAAST